MKISTVVLAASIALNAALLGIVAVGLAVNDSGSVAAPKPASVAKSAVSTGPGPGAWASLQKGDLAAERDRLRAEGFPDRLVRAILAAQIREKYAAQRKALMPVDSTLYWKSPKVDPKVTAELRALAQAERKELKDLLGPDPENIGAEMLARQIPGLSADKAETLAAIVQRYSEQRAELFSGGPNPAAAEKQQALSKAMHDEFAAVLTPQEFETYDLRASQPAVQLQWKLAAFDPTEAEFRALYKLQSAFDAQYGSYGPTSPDQMKARMEAQKQLDSDISAALGPDRYAQYERDTDYNYRTTTQLVARLNLPAETADSLYAVQKEYQQKQQDLSKTLRGQSPDQVQQTMTALQQEATARVATVFNGNSEAVDAYRTYGGQWLRNMVPRTPNQGGGVRTMFIPQASGP